MKRIVAFILAVAFLFALGAVAPDSAARADGATTVPLGGRKICGRNNVVITADELRYAAGGDIELDLTVRYSGGGMRIVYIPEMYVNDWLVYPAGDPTIPVTGGSSVKATVQVDNANTALFDIMRIDEVQKVKLAVWIFTEDYYVQSQGFSNEIVNETLPADFVQAHDDSGEVLHDDAAIRIVQKVFDPATYTALLLLEKKQTSKWTKVTLDAMYNGCRALRSNTYFLDKGVYALIPFYGEWDCESFEIKTLRRMDIYALYYHSDRLQNPFMVTLRESGGATVPEERHTPLFQASPVYEDDYCAMYYAGAVEGYYTDSDAIVLYCRNKTDDKVLALFTAYEYILLDGERVAATQSSVNVYPESVSQVVITPQGYDYADLSGYDRLETTIGVYEIAGGYHKQIKTTGKLELPLHGVADPLASGALEA